MPAVPASSARNRRQTEKYQYNARQCSQDKHSDIDVQQLRDNVSPTEIFFQISYKTVDCHSFPPIDNQDQSKEHTAQMSKVSNSVTSAQSQNNSSTA